MRPCRRRMPMPLQVIVLVSDSTAVTCGSRGQCLIFCTLMSGSSNTCNIEGSHCCYASR